MTFGNLWITDPEFAKCIHPQWRRFTPPDPIYNYLVGIYVGLMGVIGIASCIPEGFHTSCTFDYLSSDLGNLLFNAEMYLFAFICPVAVIIFSYAQIIKAVHDSENFRDVKCSRRHRSNAPSSDATCTCTPDPHTGTKSAYICASIIMTNVPPAVMSDVIYFCGNDWLSATGIVIGQLGQAMVEITHLNDATMHKRHVDQIHFKSSTDQGHQEARERDNQMRTPSGNPAKLHQSDAQSQPIEMQEHYSRVRCEQAESTIAVRKSSR
ncbi:unnamed protein product [Echinostoma caproni]|uniref:G_PROTEIN_RECEP_F1_2 domain-containing protein n=1 Tax=Echinostoma caproni TaxID=27848 RepID=A0A183A9L1_9TREM|nr:unnamed protein product [Echinostoma caproni]